MLHVQHHKDISSLYCTTLQNHLSTFYCKSQLTVAACNSLLFTLNAFCQHQPATPPASSLVLSNFTSAPTYFHIETDFFQPINKQILFEVTADQLPHEGSAFVRFQSFCFMSKLSLYQPQAVCSTVICLFKTLFNK